MVSVRNQGYLFGIPLITLIILLSFRSFAAYLAPDLNSDNAVHILMAADLQLPEDWYYWGQDRLGSLVPLLGHFLLTIFPITPATAVSYVQYFLLIFGFCCFATLFKGNLSRVIFALVWFLPLRNFTTLLKIGQPYGPQLAFIGAALVLLNRLKNDKKIIGMKRQWTIFLITLSLLISLWLSDFSIVTILLLAAILMWQNYLACKHLPSSPWLKVIFGLLDLITVLLTFILGIVFIIYAKQKSSPPSRESYEEYYQIFNNVEQVREVINKLAVSFTETITFQVNNTYLSIQAILCLVLFAYLAYLAFKDYKTLTTSRWTYLFAANALISFVLLVLSHWVYINIGDEISLRYFVPVYVSTWLFVILLAESFKGAPARRAFMLLTVIAIASSLSLPRYVFGFVAKPEPTVQKFQVAQTLGPAGFIGDYWDSYVICSTNPALLHCTPHDRSGVRCWRCVAAVLKSPTIYIVLGKRYPSFPEQTVQFGQRLLKTGEPVEIGDLTMAPYKTELAQ